jgi:hypothetical protein
MAHSRWTTLLSLVALTLAACGSANSGANASTATLQGVAAATRSTPAAAKEDLFAFAAGAQFVAKPDDNQYEDANYGPHNLIDESDYTDWSAQSGKSAVLVLELAERTKLDRVSFDTAGLNIDAKAVRGIRVEVSDTSPTDGFKQVLATELKQQTKGQSFPVAATTNPLRRMIRRPDAPKIAGSRSLRTDMRPEPRLGRPTHIPCEE